MSITLLDTLPADIKLIHKFKKEGTNLYVDETKKNYICEYQTFVGPEGSGNYKSDYLSVPISLVPSVNQLSLMETIALYEGIHGLTGDFINWADGMGQGACSRNIAIYKQIGERNLYPIIWVDLAFSYFRNKSPPLTETDDLIFRLVQTIYTFLENKVKLAEGK